METSTAPRIQIVVLVATAFLVLPGVLSLVAGQTGYSIITIAMGISLLIVNLAVGFWSRGRHKENRERFLAHYLTQLKQNLQPEARQRVLENMITLNLLPGADLSSIDLTSAYLRSAKLDGADLTATKQNSADLTGASLRGANLSYANLRYVTLYGADMTRSVLNGATLDSSDLRNVKLVNANLRGASLTEIDLSNSDLRRACLRYANLQNSNLQNANLTDADLIGCTLPDGTKWKPGTDLGQFIHPEQTVGWFTFETMTSRLFNNLKK